MNIPQPIDHQCVVAQPQLATDQQVQLAIGREDVELEEIPADDNDKVKIDSILSHASEGNLRSADSRLVEPTSHNQLSRWRLACNLFQET